MNKYLFCLVSLLPFLSFSVNAQTPVAPNALRVELLMFSGRPNPVFTITDPAEIRDLTARVNALPKNSIAAAAQTADFPVLGYQGIVVRNMSAASPELDSILVRRSNVRINRKAGPQAKAAQAQAASVSSAGASASAAPAAAAAEPSELRVDGGNALENHLLSLARNRGVLDDALMNHITSQK